VATAVSGNIGSIKLQKNAGDNTGAGGDVTVTVPGYTNITTYGNGAWGILAQSIGGGGGLLGDTSGTLGTLVSNTLPNIDKDEHSDGGTVDVSLTSTEILTYGANAHGIFAQSIGGGGGILGDSAGVQAGNSAQIYGLSGMDYSGQGGAITVGLNQSTVDTAGAGSIGIVAQSSGNADYQSQIQISLASAYVSGGSGAGAAGIALSGGDAANNGHGNVPNTITLDAGSTLTTQNGTSGTAITTNDGLTNVANAGSITGSILLGATPGTVTNSGTILTGATIQASSVTNTGTINIDAPVATVPVPYPGRTTTFTGDLVLASANGTPGKIILGADMANKTNDNFVVEGDLTGQNRLQVNPITLLPSTSLNIYQVDGNASGSLLPINPLAYDYAISPAGGGSYALSAAAHFTLPRGTTLTSTEIGGATLLQSVWDAGKLAVNDGWSQSFKQQIGEVFADAANATPAGYKAAMDVLVPHIDNAAANETLGSLQDIAAAAQNCPAFEGPDARLAEGDCVWQRTEGNFINQNDTNAGMGYGGSAVTFMLGGQKQIRPGWFAGGVAAYGESWFQSSDKLESRNQQTGAAALSLKREIGPWLVSFTAAGGGGSGSVSRVIDLPDFVQTATGNSGVGFGLGRLRAAYQFVHGRTYITPELDLDTAYIWQGGYSESGAGILDLNVGGAGKAIFAATPQVELGERIDLRGGMQLQPHITAGLTGLADGSWVTPVKLAAAPGTGYTNVKTPLPNLLGQINLGVDLYDPNGWQAKLQYGTSIGGSYNTQSVTLRLTDRF
jgi:uncharacterized protein with beta-barrel porin domain